MTLLDIDHSAADGAPRAGTPDLKLLLMGFMGAGKTTASDRMKQHGAVVWTIAELIKQISWTIIDEPDPDADGRRYDLDSLLSRVLPDRDLHAAARVELGRYAAGYTREPGVKPRMLFQDVGEMIRWLEPGRTDYCWERELAARIDSTPASFTVIDARAKETHRYFCDQRGYTSVVIDAPEDLRLDRRRIADGAPIIDRELLEHPSETDLLLLDFDHRLTNAASVSRFLADVDALIARLSTRPA